MKRSSLITILNLMHASSDDLSRPQIRGVAIKKRESDIRLISTNGHMMVDYSLDDKAFFDVLEDGVEYFFNKDSIPTIETILKRTRDYLNLDRCGKVSIEKDPEGSIVIAYPGIRVVVTNTINHPGYDAVFDKLKQNTERFKVTLNPDLLRKLSHIADKHNHDSITLSFASDNPMAVIGLESVCGNLKGVIMPMKQL